jgi:hypothetical protein
LLCIIFYTISFLNTDLDRIWNMADFRFNPNYKEIK